MSGRALRAALLLALLVGGGGCVRYHGVRGAPPSAPLAKVVIMGWARGAPTGFEGPLARACLGELSRRHLKAALLEAPSAEDAADPERDRWFEHYQRATQADAFLLGDFVWELRQVVNADGTGQIRSAPALCMVSLKLVDARTGELRAAAHLEDPGPGDWERTVAAGCDALLETAASTGAGPRAGR